jgi:lambda repressor-like predicted transcriptional regulator
VSAGTVLAEVIDLGVVRGAVERALSVEEVEARVARIREALAFSLAELASLRADGAHLVCGFGTWHEACEAWFGDLRSLRLAGSPEAVAERDALVRSLRAAGATTRTVRDRLGISSYAVQQALAEDDPAPERIVGADGASRSSRGQRREQLAPPVGRVFEQAAEWLRRAENGLTLAELARVAGWSEGKASGALSDCVRRKGTAVRSEVLRGGMRVHYPAEVGA